jgi:hypothetical protein
MLAFKGCCEKVLNEILSGKQCKFIHYLKINSKIWREDPADSKKTSEGGTLMTRVV